MTQARAKILPERRARTGIVGRKKQREHENQPAEARGPHQNSEKERDANGQLTVGHQERDRCGVPEHEPAKHRRHERVSAALKKTVDPILEAAVKRELCAENLVLAKDEEQSANADTKNCQRAGIRSEERRVGKERRTRSGREHEERGAARRDAVKMW